MNKLVKRKYLNLALMWVCVMGMGACTERVDISSSGQEISVDISSLPAAIITYVETHYPNQSIGRAHRKFEDGRWLYRIRLNNDVKLFFDLDGNFLWKDG
ncbi:MAG: hypothetical protein D6730_12870 [Bacteroidetes bacterium]|nr:MAG: hypothetical protein D6730_12870 [Bacteroidota bacterium]